MIKLGFVSAILEDLSFEETVDSAAALGYECIEMLCWPKGKAERRYAGVTHIDVASLSDDEVARIKNYLDKKGVFISGLGYYPNYLDADRAQGEFFAEHLKKIIEAAAKLGLPVVNTFIGRDHTKSMDYNLGLFKDMWPGIIKFAESKKIKIGIENCPMFFTMDEWPGGKNLAISPAIWDKMFTEIPSDYFGLNYDPSHMLWQQMDEIMPIYEYKDKLFHIHIKDVKIRKDLMDRVGIMATPLEYHSPKLPGLGDVRWGDFFAALTEVGYQGPACVEVEDRAYEGSLEDRKAALKQSRNYISQFIPGK